MTKGSLFTNASASSRVVKTANASNRRYFVIVGTLCGYRTGVRPHYITTLIARQMQARAIIEASTLVGRQRRRVEHRVDGLVGLIGCPPSLPAERRHCLVWFDQVIFANVAALFPGMQIVEVYSFRVTRNADMEIAEEKATDLLRTIEQEVRAGASAQRFRQPRTKPGAGPATCRSAERYKHQGV